jgi:undecaprenyl-diphosphatase
MQRNLLINIVIFGGVLYLFGWQLRGVSESLTALRQADVVQTLCALAAIIVSYVAAALSYQALAIRRLQFRATLAVQVASGFTNRLLPAGLGGLGLFAAYYKKQGHTLPVSSALVATNNLVGFIGNSILLIAVVLLHPSYIRQFNGLNASGAVLIIAAGIVAGLCLFLFIRQDLLRRLMAFVRATWHALRVYLRPNSRTVKALLCNMIATSCNVLALSLAVSAAHGSLDWPAALLVLSLGTAIGAAVPTPGGIGGVEAGLLAGMVAFNVSPASGLAAVFLYRGLSYWLPIIPGIVAFRLIEKRLL